MKKRSISALVMILIAVPIVILGGTIYNIGIMLVAILGLKELLDIKETESKLPKFVKTISYLFMLTIIITSIGTKLETFSIDFRIISGLFFTFLIPTLLYHDKKKYSISDAFYMIGAVFFLSISLTLFISIRSYDLNLLVYLLLIAMMTDTFAYVIGSLIGKTKLLVDISPNKTWEGTIAGTAMGTFIPTVFYLAVVNPTSPVLKVVLMTMMLSVLGQFGDLFFSAIKRHYGKKDFSNLIPGHGGVLDRIDSMVFILLGFMFLISVV